MKGFIIYLIIFAFPLNLRSQIIVDINFEGGNAQVININNSTNTIKIRSQLKGGDTKAVVFYLKILMILRWTGNLKVT